jgi:hypothetical protein
MPAVQAAATGLKLIVPVFVGTGRHFIGLLPLLVILNFEKRFIPYVFISEDAIRPLCVIYNLNRGISCVRTRPENVMEYTEIAEVHFTPYHGR